MRNKWKPLTASKWLSTSRDTFFSLQKGYFVSKEGSDRSKNRVKSREWIEKQIGEFYL